MSLSSLLAVLVSVVLGTGASPEAELGPSTSGVLGLPFALEEGESALIDGALRLTFVGVVQDSRCPIDVQCVWEGDATVEIGAVTGDGTPARLCLHTNPGLETEAIESGYRVALLDLQPYPALGDPVTTTNRVTLVVVRIDQPTASMGPVAGCQTDAVA